MSDDPQRREGPADDRGSDGVRGDGRRRSDGGPDPGRGRAARDRDAADLRSHPRVHWHPGRVDGARVRRIVSLVPSLSEALVALGLGDRLVGVTEYCVEPPGAFDGLPRLGGTKDADVEAIASCEPDLVLANQEENTARVVRRLAQRDIDVRVTYPRTVREGVRLLSELADLGADATTRSRILAPVEQAWAAAEARRRPGEGPRVFCPIWRDPWMTIGPETYIHDLIELSGGCNVFGRGAPKTVDGAPDPGAGAPRERRYPVVSLEAVEAAQPEVILLPDEPYAFGSEDAEQLGLLDVPAAKTGRIVPIDGSLVSWYGPRIAQAIQVLAAIFAKP